MIAVRAFVTSDAEPVQNIIASCTFELRAFYVPKPEIVSASYASVTSRVVAVDNTDTVIGVAECIDHLLALYVQGVAVAPTHRRLGVASAILNYMTKLAVDKGYTALEVATIKETGNVEIFKRLGFAVFEERTSERFLGQHGQSVTEVTLKRYVPNHPLEGT